VKLDERYYRSPVAHPAINYPAGVFRTEVVYREGKIAPAAIADDGYVP